MHPSVKIVVIAGIRAQFMKLAAFQHAIKEWNISSAPRFIPICINSGQHYDDDLAGIFIRDLGIKFDIDLTGKYQDLRPIWLLGDMTARIYDVLAEIDPPNWVIVFGDANTTLAGALAAAKIGFPIIHIEAGLRIGDLRSPEEVNRIVTDHLSTVHFVSSKQDMTNLIREGLATNAIWTGDLIGDLVSQLLPTLNPTYGEYSAGKYILASIHREENVRSDMILHNVLYSLSSQKRNVIFITHPRVRSRLKDLDLHQLNNIQYVSTLPYKDMLSAMNGCAFLFTDSGAFQRESYYLKKHCLIRQDKPFWSSLVNANVHKAVGKSLYEISAGLHWAEQAIMESNYPVVDDLGDGNAGKRILKYIANITDSYTPD